MIINKGIKSMARLISGSANIKPGLAGLFFKQNKVIATDNFKLMEIEFKNDNINDDIKIDNFKHRINEDVMIKTEDILNIKIPKNISNKLLENIFIGNIDNENIGLATNDGKKEIVIKTKQMKGVFIDYEKFFNNSNQLEVGFNVEHMMDILTVYKSFGIKQLKMSLDEPLSPITLNAYDKGNLLYKDVLNIKTILMPINLKI